MAGLYPDKNESPRDYLGRLQRKIAAGQIRDADRPVIEGGIAWATAEIEKQKAARSATAEVDTDS